MTASSQHRATCLHCGREFSYERFHAGFSNLGYMYCDEDETVITWSTYNPAYIQIIHDKHPWVLDRKEQQKVEASLKPCPYGGCFSFDNPPLCPFCHESVAFLVQGKEYFIVTGRRVDGDREDVWLV
jgi:hypothetical protein